MEADNDVKSVNGIGGGAGGDDVELAQGAGGGAGENDAKSVRKIGGIADHDGGEGGIDRPTETPRKDFVWCSDDGKRWRLAIAGGSRDVQPSVRRRRVLAGRDVAELMRRIAPRNCLMRCFLVIRWSLWSDAMAVAVLVVLRGFPTTVRTDTAIGRPFH